MSDDQSNDNGNGNGILVLGATGSTGRRVARLLRDAGHPVRPASRSGEVRFDWADTGTWERALDSVSAMYLMAPDGTPVDPRFVARAVERGVRRIVLLSSGGIEAMGDQRLLDAEAAVRGCGAEWTILRPDWFAQNFDEGFYRDDIIAGELAIPLGGMRQAFVDAGDIAAVAAAALTEDGHAKRAYAVSGPRALSFAEALDTIGAAAGRTVRFRGSDAEFLAGAEAAGMPKEAAEGAVTAFTALRAQGDTEPTDTVRRVTGREPKDFAAYAAEAAASGAWRG